MHARTGAIEADGELEAVDRERDEIRAGAGDLHLDVVERLASERGQCVAHLGGAVGERTAAGQPAERLDRRLFALRAVEAADAAARQAEIEDLLECLRLVVAELAVL